MKQTKITLFLLLIGLVLRAGVAFSQDPRQAYLPDGGDTAWYLGNGEGLLSGAPFGVSSYGVPFYVEVIPVPPLYLLFVGMAQALFGSGALAIIVIRAMQVLMSVAVAWWVADVAVRIAGNQRAGVFVLGAMLFDPSQIIEPSVINTETLYIFWITLGVWASVRLQAHQRPVVHQWAAIGIALGLATLTRAVSLLFPIMLVAHALFFWRGQWRMIGRGLVVFVVVYSATVGIWTGYNALFWGRFVVASDQFMPAVWRGAVSPTGSPQENDALLMRPEELPDDCERDCKFQVPATRYVEQTLATITADIVGYVRLRVSQLAESYLTPHSTIVVSGEGLRALVLTWARDGFTGAGFVRLINGENFWLKLAIYVFHVGAIGAGLVGAWRARANARLVLIPLAFIAYTTGIHVILLALPRYIFPLFVCWWMLAGGVFRPKTTAS